MNVVILNTGPRSAGNGAFIAQALEEKYAEESCTSLHTGVMNIGGCTGCLTCRKNGSLCVVKDDMQAVYDPLLAADLVILIAPNYYGFLPGQTKSLLDRWYCLKDANRRTKFNENAKLFFLFTQGSPNRDHASRTLEWMKRVSEGFGMKFYGMGVPSCADANTDGARLRMDDVRMSLNMFA